MKQTEIAVIGGGPAGLSAAAAAASLGAKVSLVDNADRLGGQLVKQTHMFFGSKEQYASIRGIDIGKLLAKSLPENVEVMVNTTAFGLFPDGVITLDQGGTYRKLLPKRIVIATGASEKVLAFPNNDLPGVYGAGAVQTLMNVHGVKPGERVLMVGAGNIGLIVSYQLLQAGVEVAAVIEGAPRIGGYLVHAAKIRRAGVPIYTSTTIVKALGDRQVTGAVIAQVDENWRVIAGSERQIDCDVICLAVGLSPMCELLWQAGCRMKYIPELGGHIAWHNERMETSRPGIFVAGDAAGVEEASSAMVEGTLAGLYAAKSLGYSAADFAERVAKAERALHDLRKGPVGEKIRRGLSRLLDAEGVSAC